MIRSLHCWLVALGLLSVSGVVAPAAAVGPGFTFQGQLLDNSLPRNGPCDFRFQLFSLPTGGIPIDSRTEIIPFVSVQNGLFTVKLNSSGQLGPRAFDGNDRWLEITARCPAIGAGGSFGTPFSPRQEITAVPYALYVPPQPPAGTRFTDNADLTVTDHSTGLMWAKKTGTYNSGAPINCDTTTCADASNVNNLYGWCDDALNQNRVCDNFGPYNDNPPDGGVFYDFLARTNGELCDSSTCTGLAGYTDWRIPTLAELRTIVPSPCPADPAPCIDPVFGVTARNGYRSSTTRASAPSMAFVEDFGAGGAYTAQKADAYYVRAVRGGL